MHPSLMQIHTEKGIHKGIHLVWIFFHKHSPFTGQQGRGGGGGGGGYLCDSYLPLSPTLQTVRH